MCFISRLGFLIFFVCALAECNRTPFDLSEAESELNMGYHQEYSSMKLGFYLFAEYVNMFISSAVMATYFLGVMIFLFLMMLISVCIMGRTDWQFCRD